MAKPAIPMGPMGNMKPDPRMEGSISPVAMIKVMMTPKKPTSFSRPVARLAVSHQIRNVEDWLTNIDNQSPQAIIANMNDDRLDVPNLLKTIKAQPKIQDVPILAFANHEEVGTWKLAKELGINKIVSRNEFSARTLPLLEEMLASTPPTP